MIGKLVSKNNMTELMDKIENGSYETIHMRIVDACVLSNNRLLASTHRSISILDERFNIIKEIEKIDGNYIYSYGVAFNNKKHCIYASCVQSHCIYMLDLDLNKIKSFGSQGSNNNNLDCPSGICLNDDHLYVCDTRNVRIQILNSDLQFIDTIKLINCHPEQIKIIGSTMCIFKITGSIQFYDLKNTKQLKKQHDELDGRLSRIDSFFYLVTSKMLYYFDANGNIIKEMKIERFSNLIWNALDGILLYFNNRLIVISFNTDTIIKFL
jgi:hypothetical protein